MNLLTDPWIPVRTQGGTGAFRLLTLEEVLCHDGDGWVSLPRDDLELATVQLLVCMVQVMFLPGDEDELRDRLAAPLAPERLADGVRPCHDWFDLDHPTQPFMQSRGVQSKEVTPIQKLLIGLPEGNNHSFFNEVGEVRQLGGAVTAIALFNQACNCPSFGGGFKASLRGGSPVTTLLKGHSLRETVWKNVVTREGVEASLPGYVHDLKRDRPVWVDSIAEKQFAHDIGLARGLFWQPAKVELVASGEAGRCDVLGVEGPVYAGLRKEKFNYTVEGLWPHPHGARVWDKAKKAWKFVSFTTEAPAWNWLSEFVVPSPLDQDAKAGATPAAPVSQAADLFPGEPLHLLVGGYRVNQAAVEQRRHDLFSLAQGWHSHRDYIQTLVETGKTARKALRGKLWYAAQGDKEKGLKGLGAPLEEVGDKHFYSRTEHLFHDTLRESATWADWQKALTAFKKSLSETCHDIFEKLTEPYAMKAELVPIIARARHSLEYELSRL
jgi:CRISPR system Cascade subunit CasA